MAGRLAGKRVLVTQADDYMGPATLELFAEEGATVVADTRDLRAPGACEAAVAEAGHVDVLIGNLASHNFSGIPATDLSDEDWHETFNRMVHPLHQLTRAVLPQMIERRRGKIVVYGSAVALKGLKTVGAYSAARAAQAGYVQAVGVEVAPHNVQINLIAQNYVENPVYYPPELMEKESFVKSLETPGAARPAGHGPGRCVVCLVSRQRRKRLFCRPGHPILGGLDAALASQ